MFDIYRVLANYDETIKHNLSNYVYDNAQILFANDAYYKNSYKYNLYLIDKYFSNQDFYGIQDSNLFTSLFLNTKSSIDNLYELTKNVIKVGEINE